MGERGGEVKHGDNKPVLKDLKSASMLLLLTFIMGDCHDGDTHRGPAILLISVNIEK